MKKKTQIVIYITIIILVFIGIFLIWAYDTGRLGAKADVRPQIESAEELKSLPNPDQSTFSKIFGIIASLFSR